MLNMRRFDRHALVFGYQILKFRVSFVHLLRLIIYIEAINTSNSAIIKLRPRNDINNRNIKRKAEPATTDRSAKSAKNTPQL